MAKYPPWLREKFRIGQKEKFEVISRTKGFFDRLSQDALKEILDNNLRGELGEERYWIQIAANLLQNA